jgi:hypothetical protein
MICADANLAILDRRVADLFAIAQAEALDAGDVKRGQRRWLGDRDDCKDVACVTESYRQRIGQLQTETGRFSPADTKALCESFVDPDTRTKVLASTIGAEDINNDGRPDRASQCSGGAANVPCVAFTDEDDEPLAIARQGLEWLTYNAAGRAPFRFEGRTFTYYALDAALEQPAYLSYITPTNREMRVCDFDTVVGSAVLEGGEEICAAIEANDERIELFEWTPVTDPHALIVERPHTVAHASGKVDVDNDGLEESLVEFVYSNSAGRGCETNYFELLADDGRNLAINSNAAAVRELQALGETGVDERSCGSPGKIANRLLRFGDKIYFESNTGNTLGALHEVKILQGAAVANICAFERQVRTKVKTLY